jgi:hypothetical protein
MAEPRTREEDMDRDLPMRDDDTRGFDKDTDSEDMEDAEGEEEEESDLDEEDEE